MKPVSNTAFYCTGVRALDARRAQPICGDQYAERFMDDRAWAIFEPFRKFVGPNTANAARARIIDDLLRERIAANPNTLIVLIGAGFDSRAFRLTGGRWLEVDEPQVFAWKEPRLPAADSPNALTRLPVDFATEKLADRLQPFADPGPVVIVVEGVLMYLGEQRIRELLQTLRATFPRGEILCDVMTVEFFNRFSRGIHEKVSDLGASFTLPERPLEQIFAEEHFTQTRLISIGRHAPALKLMPFPMRLAVRLMKAFATGYTVRAFTPM
jgi:methyltransferase (TIGR00027 family)